MANSDRDYFSRRAAQETAAASRASSPQAKEVHEHLAGLYLARASQMEEPNGPAAQAVR